MKLTSEQIKNWRRVLVGTLGVYALVVPVEDIEKIVQRMQEEANGKSPTNQPK